MEEKRREGREEREGKRRGEERRGETRREETRRGGKRREGRREKQPSKHMQEESITQSDYCSSSSGSRRSSGSNTGERIEIGK